MAYESLTYKAKEHVATISINAPVKDRIEMALLSDELRDVCLKIRSDNEIRVVVVTSNSDNGFSLGEGLISDISSAEEDSVIKSCTLAETIAGVTQPIIAGIKGNAVGQSLELALACDLRIASENAAFGTPEVTLGIIPGWGGTQRLPRAIPKGKAAELLLMGQRIDAQEAYRIGLVNKVVPLSELLSTAEEWAQKLCEIPPLAVRAAKEAMCKGLDMTLEEGLGLETELEDFLFTTEDSKEGRAAFREKRKPVLKGK